MKERIETNAILLADFYKFGHIHQYPDKTEFVYSTWTARTSRFKGINDVVAFGFQGFIVEYLIDYFNKNFFKRPREEVVAEYCRIVKYCLFVDDPDASHVIALHNLGYLPLKIQAVPEGTIVPVRVPMLTMENTLPEFYWVTNFIETLMSCCLWQPATSATIAHEYKKLLTYWSNRTVGNTAFIPFQGHDFSMRGLGHLGSATTSGAGHLTSFKGTDSVPSISYLENYYNADVTKELVGCSVPATEHSVMCAGGKEDEYDTFDRIISKVYPTGIVSIVSDTWDLWKVLTDTIPKLKNKILARDGKVVIRPDSGDPVDIVCGTESRNGVSPHEKGVVELLWDTFGGTITAEGYKLLDSHIGVIYGDAITLERCNEICTRLADKGFASTNMVFGIGSFTYQYNTRDTFGFALKSTHVVMDGIEHAIFKNPVTDDGVKKSQIGRVVVLKDEDGKLFFEDGFNRQVERGMLNANQLQIIFVDGFLMNETSLSEIRARLDSVK